VEIAERRLSGTVIDATPLIASHMRTWQSSRHGQLLRERGAGEGERTRAQRADEAHQVPGLGRIVETVEAVQRDWLMTGASLDSQDLGALAADVARFRQSLSVPLIRQEKDVTTTRRDRADREPLQLGRSVLERRIAERRLQLPAY
jgi:hypothetical protein